MEHLDAIIQMVAICAAMIAIIFGMIALIKQNNRDELLNDIYEYLQSIYENQNEFEKDDFIEAQNAINAYCLIRISDIASITRKPPYERSDYKYEVTLVNKERFTTNYIPERCANLIDNNKY